MATLNLGRIKPVFRGAYAGGTAYVIDDIVTSGNETFICIQASTGNATSNASYWTKLAAKGADGTDVGATLTTQGDILYRDGSGLQRLAAGTSGQLLQSGGSGANVSWTNAPSGKLKQIVNGYWENGGSEWTTTSQSFVDTPLTFNITPTASTSKILVSFVTNGSRSNSQSNNAIFTIKRAISGGATTDLGSGSTYALAHTYSPNPSIQTLQKVDAPNTTSQITYTVQARSDGGTADLARRSSQSTYYAIEIGA